MLTAEDLEQMQRSLAEGDKTTGELARECAWTLNEAKSYLTQLAAEGVVVKVRPTADSESKKRRWQSGTLDGLGRAERVELAQRVAAGEPPAPSTKFATADPSAREARRPRIEGADALNPYAPPRHVDDPPELHTDELSPESQGSFWLGFLAGLFGGCIIILLVVRRSKPKTKEGLYWGFGTGVVLAIFLRLLDT